MEIKKELDCLGIKELKDIIKLEVWALFGSGWNKPTKKDTREPVGKCGHKQC